MTLQLELWHALLLVGAFLAVIARFGRVLLGQIDRRLDERFKAQAELLDGNTAKVDRLERDFLEFRADLPLHYVRREDYVRGQSIVEAKLDGLAAMVSNAQLRASMKDRGSQ